MNAIITNDTLVARHIAVISQKTGSTLLGASKALLIEECKRQMRNGVCHFVYLKKADKNGHQEVREAFGTLNKGVLHATLKGTGESPENWGCCFYHDCIKGGARSFRWANIIAVL